MRPLPSPGARPGTAPTDDPDGGFRPGLPARKSRRGGLEERVGGAERGPAAVRTPSAPLRWVLSWVLSWVPSWCSHRFAGSRSSACASRKRFLKSRL